MLNPIPCCFKPVIKPTAGWQIEPVTLAPHSNNATLGDKKNKKLKIKKLTSDCV
jgi:hypothetical protein